MQSSHSFPYTPLDSSSSEIRLVTLRPGEWNDPIQCGIHHVMLDARPSYEALSYVWGNPAATHDIELHGCLFSVTVNLEIALRHLRGNAPRVLWIDALCINQNDPAEKSQQVQRMRGIYTSADTVLSWLGEASHDSDEGMYSIKAIGEIYERVEASDAVQVTMPATPESVKTLGFDLEVPNRPALFKIFDRPYWTRIWILQELANSGGLSGTGEDGEDRCLIGCGHIWLRKGLFLGTYMILLYLTRSPPGPFAAPGKPTEFPEPFRSLHGRGQIPGAQMLMAINANGADTLDDSIFTLLHATSYLEATDPRDNIYALLGLSRSGNVAGIVPDYTKSVEQVYMELVSTTMMRDRTLECLRGNRLTQRTHIPSWATPYGRVSAGGFPWVHEHRDAYKACGDRLCDARFDLQNGLLLSTGTTIGVIDTVIGPFGEVPSGDDNDVMKRGARSWLIIFDYASEVDEAQWEDLWRTLIMDQDTSDWDNPVLPAPAQLGDSLGVMAGRRTIPKDFKPNLSDEDREKLFLDKYQRCMDESLHLRCFFTTDSGFMGLGPYFTKPGDTAALLLGGDFCFVLRPKGSHFDLVGDAYVHRAMHGELISFREDGTLMNGNDFILC